MYHWFNLEKLQFQTGAEVRPRIMAACKQAQDIARFVAVGKSEAGRDIDGVILGNGPHTVTLIAGAHSDEPVGPETLRTLILEGIRQREQLTELFKTCRLVIIPQINPDGEAQNWQWIRQWPDVNAYLAQAFRELPGRDLEFGFPDMRIENRQTAAVLRQHGPVHLHMSLHGMGFAEGVMLLIEENWIERTAILRQKFLKFAKKCGLPLHDHDRKGEKGFGYIGPGFSTTPRGKAMQAYFRNQGDETTAACFHLSSMEYLRELGGDPLCLVTELPLFVLGKAPDEDVPGIPTVYNTFLKSVPQLRLKLLKGESIQETLDSFKISAIDLKTAVEFQLYIIQQALTLLKLV